MYEVLQLKTRNYENIEFYKKLKLKFVKILKFTKN
jgi:hypothetical protein